ncbi:hypothetical protein Goarm_005847 [Gossypium armourianum]|uniref:Uncharacterized protein n=1 Tax=Gossypium armourianum TaxID=34283 RepID=A0A7J9KF85_9ROSI|nr:hypothetical protein [Gossypium armourianum]
MNYFWDSPHQVKAFSSL